MRRHLLENAPRLNIDDVLYGKDNEVRPQGILERRIVWNLLKYLNENGFVVYSTWDGEEEVKHNGDNKSAMECIFNLDEVSVRVERAENPKDYHGILLVLGEGTTLITDWNFYHDDRDGFNAVMVKFEAEDYC